MTKESMKIKDKVYVWFDPEGDFLEVTLDASKDGDMEQTADRRIAVKVDDDGNIIGFHILHVSALMDENELPFEVDLSSRAYAIASATR